MDASAADCRVFLTPNQDIAGLGVVPYSECSNMQQVRLSVYSQILFCILLLSFTHADDLVKASFRGAVLFLYALGVALAVSPGHGSGSSSPAQTNVVLHSITSCLLLSSFALMCFRPSLRIPRHIIALVGAVPLGIWTLVITIMSINNTQCGQYEVVLVTERGIRIYMAVWAASIATYGLILPMLGLL
jgi:hypothetical protein